MNITELKELAEKAAGWKLDATMQTDDDRDEGIAFVGATNDEGIFSDVARIDTGLYYQPDKAIEVANFYAAANPVAILELITQLEDAQGEIRALRATEAGLVERVKALEFGLSEVEALMDESYGVAGLHLNGDVAPWSELRSGGRFETWLLGFDEARALLEKKE